MSAKGKFIYILIAYTFIRDFSLITQILTNELNGVGANTFVVRGLVYKTEYAIANEGGSQISWIIWVGIGKGLINL